MHYIQKSPAPQKLRENFGKWTTICFQYYALPSKERKKAPKPSKSQKYWLIPEIRKPLIRDFLDNCGYCGIGINTKENAEGELIPFGQTDHNPILSYLDETYLNNFYLVKSI